MAFDDIKHEIQTRPGLKTSMAKWGAAGVVAGLVLPGLGSIVGGLAGAGFAYYKRNRR